MSHLEGDRSLPWVLGDYGRVAEDLQPVADRLIAGLAVRGAQSLLDVATGTGNVALAGARAGATVTGIDISPELLDMARHRANACGLRVEYREGDAEALPVEDASFDVVVSAFGVMFASDHNRAAAELVRVCRPGGRIGLANWVPEGALATFAGLVAAVLPPLPGAASPGLWGREPYVRSRLEPHGVDVSFSYERVSWEAESPEAYLALQERIQGNLIAARRVLGTGRPWPRLRQQLLEVLEAGNEDPSGFRVASTALVAIGRRREPSEGA